MAKKNEVGVINTSAVQDVRKVMSGKDGALYDENGTMLATAESWQTQTTINNGTYQPIGDAQEHGFMTSFRVTLNFTEIVIKSSEFFRQLIKGMRNHNLPMWTFRGYVRNPYDGSYENVIYRDCVLDGNIDLQNMQVGEAYKRPWSFIVNQAPELQDEM